MQDMISRIINMDKKAREITQAAQKEKLESESTIGDKAALLREEVLTNARHRIQINRELEDVVLEQEWSKIKSHYDEQLKNMDSLYIQQGDAWVGTIVDRVLND